MSLFASLQNGVSGLNAASSGLNTTAHNLANTKTAGYTRQQTIQKDMYYQTFKVSNNGAMKIGMGTYVADVRQIRDMFLDKLAGEPVDVLVNGKFVAKGEVVVIEENFGIRLVEISK